MQFVTFFSLLILSGLAGGVATDSQCGSGTCAADDTKGSVLMQLGSQQRAQKVDLLEATDMSSLAEQLDTKKLSLASIDNFIAGIAEKVALQNYKMNPTETTALQTIKDYITQTFTDAETQHTEDQAEVDQARDLIKGCADDATASLAGDVAGLKTTVDTARQTHETCRTDESSFQTSACTDYDTYRKSDANAAPPECVSTKLSKAYVESNDETQKNAMGACLEETEAWLKPLYEKYVACKEQSGAKTTKSAECNINQHAFESGFCSYTSKLEDACDTQDSCRTRTVEARKQTHERVAISAKTRKDDYSSGKHVLCFFKVFDKETTDKAKVVDECKALAVETSKFDITFPDAPSAHPCEKSAAKTCEATWVSNEYSSKSWFSGSTMATCQSCPAPAATPATPATPAAPATPATPATPEATPEATPATPEATPATPA